MICTEMLTQGHSARGGAIKVKNAARRGVGVVRSSNVEIGGTLGGTESFLFRLFTPFHAFLRLKGKTFCATGELDGS
jgi:hypothetical protein